MSDATFGEISLRQLRYFAAVVQSGSANKAAEQLGLTQPAITQSLIRLEESLACQLFERRATGSFLSTEGNIFLLRVQRALRYVENAVVLTAPKGYSAAKRRSIQLGFTSPQILTLTAIDSQQSFVRAALQRNISKSALNRQARDLELLIGAELFTNGVTGRTTNRAGRQMAGMFRLALREIDAGCDEVGNFQQNARSSVVIGMLPLSAAHLMTTVIARMTGDLSTMRIKVVEGPFESLEHWLRSGQVDLLLTTLRSQSLRQLKQIKLFDVPYSVVARVGHPLMVAGAVTAEDIASYEWILPRDSTPRRAAAEALFATLPRRPEIRIETSSLALTRELIASSDRITVFSREQSMQAADHVILSPIDFQIPGIPRSLGVIAREDWLPTAMQKRFLDILLSTNYNDMLL